MGVLIAFLRNTFGLALGSWFGGQISNITLLIAYIAAFAVLSAGLMIAFNTAWSVVQVASPSWAVWGFGFLPDNVDICITTVIDAKIALWVYQLKTGLLDKRTSMLHR